MMRPACEEDGTAMTTSELLREHVIVAYGRMLEAWNRRDPDGFAALFTRSASVVGFDGSQMSGPAEIASELRGIFRDHATAAYVARVREVRPVDAHVMLLRAVVGMVPPGTRELNPAANAVQSLIFVMEAGRPKIELLQNTPAALHGRPHLAEQLTHELEAVVRAGRIVDAG
jgi:uncharacterized protein (TIGR02246 family)